MKRFLLFCMVVGLLAGQASADMYQMDTTTAKDMLQIGSVSAGDLGALEYVGYNDGQSLADEVWGTTWNYYGAGTMFYSVGFSGSLFDNDDSGLAQLTIGLSTPGLSGNYAGFMLPLANDNDDIWQYRAYVKVGDSTTYSDSGIWTDLGPGEFTTLIVNFSTGINFNTVTGIGFEIRWNRSLNDTSGDIFSTSVVPVPAAVLLGILGLGVVGLKLRKYA